MGFFSIDFGLGETIARYVAKYQSEKNNQFQIDLINVVIRIYFVITFLIVSLLLIVYGNIGYFYSGLSQMEMEIFKSVFVLIIIYCATSVFFSPINGILIGNERFLFIKVTEVINKSAFILLTFYVLFIDPNIKYLIYSYMISGIVVIAIKIFYFKE